MELQANRNLRIWRRKQEGERICKLARIYKVSPPRICKIISATELKFGKEYLDKLLNKKGQTCEQIQLLKPDSLREMSKHYTIDEISKLTGITTTGVKSRLKEYKIKQEINYEKGN